MLYADFDQFLDAMQPRLARARHMHVGALLAERSGETIVLLGRVTTHNVPPASAHSLDVAFGDLRGVSFVLPRSRFRALLKQLQCEELPTSASKDSVAARLPLIEGVPSMWQNEVHVPRRLVGRDHGLDWPAARASLRGPHASNALDYGVIERSVAQLPSRALPFRDLADLLRTIGLPASWHSTNDTRFHLIVPEWVRLAPCRIDHTRRAIQACVETRGPLPRDTSLAVICDASRRRFSSAMLRPAPNQPSLRCREVPVAGTKGTVDVCLSVRDQILDSTRLGLPSARLHAFLALDDQRKGLEKALFEKADSKPQDQFEAGVAWLLCVLGFSCVSLDAHTIKNTPDILAFAAGDQVAFVIECSTQLPDRQKLKMLETRACTVAAAVGAAGMPCPVYSLFVTARPAIDLAPATLARATDASVGLITSDCMRSMLSHLDAGADHHFFAADFINRVTLPHFGLLRGDEM